MGLIHRVSDTSPLVYEKRETGMLTLLPLHLGGEIADPFEEFNSVTLHHDEDGHSHHASQGSIEDVNGHR